LRTRIPVNHGWSGNVGSWVSDRSMAVRKVAWTASSAFSDRPARCLARGINAGAVALKTAVSASTSPRCR